MSYQNDLDNFVENICSELKTLVIDGLKPIQTNGDKMNPKDRNKIAYMPVFECHKLLEDFGRKIVRECAQLCVNFRVEKYEKIDKVCKELEETKTELNHLRNELIETKIDMDKHSQFGRREMIRMHNVPEPPQVNH